MLKKILTSLLLLFTSLVLVFSDPVLAKNESVNLYLFWSKTCPHCKNEIAFLKKINPRYENMAIYDFEMSENRDNALIWKRVGEQLDIDIGSVPMLLVGTDVITGYRDEKTTGVSIEALVI